MIRITLDSPPVNALGTQLMSQLRADLDAAGGDAVLLTGAGRAFSAGLDLAEVVSLSTVEMQAFLSVLEDVVGALYHYPGPTVAFVNGHAIAGGCVLALACDVRIGAEGRYKMGLNEVAIGLQFPPRTLEIVTRQLPDSARHRVMLGAGLCGPPQAVELGLLDQIGDLEAAESLATQLGRHPASAYAATKAALRPSTTPTDAVNHAFLSQVVPAWTSDQVRATISAILAPSRG